MGRTNQPSANSQTSIGKGKQRLSAAILLTIPQSLRISLSLLLSVCVVSIPSASKAQPFPLRTHQPLYQNPFDLASGGASITRATQEGSFFVNPSLPAFGGGLHRWAFARTQLHVGDAPAKAAYQAYGEQGAASPAPESIIKDVIDKPVHLGHDTALGYINRYFSTVGFSNARADIALRKFGDEGTPQLRVRAYGIGGGGVAVHYALGDLLAIGASTKYLEVAQVTEDVSAGSLQDPTEYASRLPDLLKRGTGIAHDAGLTLQIRSRNLDFRLAGTIHDIGTTQLGKDLEPYPETIAAGAGVTLHGRKHAMHCGADLRDVLEAYGEHWTFRSYAGCKILFYQLIGIGGGLSQGYPSAGMIIDLPASRFEAGIYTREVGSQIGLEGRSVYFFALGFEI